MKLTPASELPSELRLTVNGLPLVVRVSAPVTLSRSQPVPAVPAKFVTSSWYVLPPYHCTLSAVRMPGLLPGETVAPLVMTTPVLPVKSVPLPLRVALLAITTWLFKKAVPPTSWKSAGLLPLPTTRFPTLL